MTRNRSPGSDTLYYRIADDIALRGWRFINAAYYRRGEVYAEGLSSEELELLLCCDSEHDLPDGELLSELLEKGLIEPCIKGERPSEWSVYRKYEHRYFPKMNLMITGRCNYNCLHCFNAADNAPLMSEWSFEDICTLLDEAAECGVNAFTITGGEPMLHPHFMEIIREIYKRNMMVFELNTNGYFITQEKLDLLRETGCEPLIKISFDGIGTHDWMRAHKGAEEKTLAAIRLCIENGFKVMVQTQVNKKTQGTLKETARLMNDLGAVNTRFIKTTEVSRWLRNAPEAQLSFEEYLSLMLDFCSWYAESGMTMNIDVWQLMKLFPQSKAYLLEAVLCREGEYRSTAPVCKGNRGMIGVTSSGNVIPCLQMSGSYELLGIELESLYEHSLKELLCDSAYLRSVCTNLYKLSQNNSKCGECSYFRYCCGGCRALGMVSSVDAVEAGRQVNYFGEDKTKCLFYYGGWYQRCVDALPDWENLSRVDALERNT